MSNMTGTINPVVEIIKMARKVKARVLIDGAQSVQHLGIDVKKLTVISWLFPGIKCWDRWESGRYTLKGAAGRNGRVFNWRGMISEVYTDQPAVWAKGVENGKREHRM